MEHCSWTLHTFSRLKGFVIPTNSIPLLTYQLFPHLYLFSSFEIRLPTTILFASTQTLTRLASKISHTQIMGSGPTHLCRDTLRRQFADKCLYAGNDQKSKYDPENDSQELIDFAWQRREHEDHEDYRDNYVQWGQKCGLCSRGHSGKRSLCW